MMLDWKLIAKWKTIWEKINLKRSFSFARENVMKPVFIKLLVTGLK